jgi:hypothetical protein
MLSGTQQRLLVLKVGETVNPPGLLAASVADLATQYSGLDARVSQLGPGYSLEMLYTERDLVLVAMGACRANVQNSTDKSLSLDQQEAQRLQAMYANVQTEITRVEDLARRSRPALVGQITTAVPEANPGPGGPNAADVAYRGDPYYPFSGSLVPR